MANIYTPGVALLWRSKYILGVGGTYMYFVLLDQCIGLAASNKCTCQHQHLKVLDSKIGCTNLTLMNEGREGNRLA